MRDLKAIYKILRELQVHNGKYDIHKISAKALGMNYEGWEQLMILIQEEGYIKGLVVDNFVKKCDSVVESWYFR